MHRCPFLLADGRAAPPTPRSRSRSATVRVRCRSGRSGGRRWSCPCRCGGRPRPGLRWILDRGDGWGSPPRPRPLPRRQSRRVRGDRLSPDTCSARRKMYPSGERPRSRCRPMEIPGWSSSRRRAAGLQGRRLSARRMHGGLVKHGQPHPLPLPRFGVQSGEWGCGARAGAARPYFGECQGGPQRPVVRATLSDGRCTYKACSFRYRAWWRRHRSSTVATKAWPERTLVSTSACRRVGRASTSDRRGPTGSEPGRSRRTRAAVAVWPPGRSSPIRAGSGMFCRRQRPDLRPRSTVMSMLPTGRVRPIVRPCCGGCRAAPIASSRTCRPMKSRGCRDTTAAIMSTRGPSRGRRGPSASARCPGAASRPGWRPRRGRRCPGRSRGGRGRSGTATAPPMEWPRRTTGPAPTRSRTSRTCSDGLDGDLVPPEGVAAPEAREAGVDHPPPEPFGQPGALPPVHRAPGEVAVDADRPDRRATRAFGSEGFLVVGYAKS